MDGKSIEPEEVLRVADSILKVNGTIPEFKACRDYIRYELR